MILFRTPGKINITINEDVFKQTRSFKYLNAMFSEENNTQAEITHTINAFTCNLHLLYPLMKKRNIPR